jgi:hypothetical protein
LDVLANCCVPFLREIGPNFADVAIGVAQEGHVICHFEDYLGCELEEEYEEGEDY